MRLFRYLVSLLLMLTAASVPAQGQVGALDLNTTWRVHSGNDPAFSAPALDDSGWAAIHPGDPVPDAAGATDLWYRTRVSLPPGSHDLSLSLVDDNLSNPGSFGGCPEFFVNAILIGHATGFPRCVPSDYSLGVLPIPNSLLTQRDLVLAVHFTLQSRGAATQSRWPGHRSGFQPHTHLLLGPTQELENERILYYLREYTSNAIRALLILILLIIVIAFARNLPRAPEYRILIVFLLADLASNLLLCATGLVSTQTTFTLVDFCAAFATVICWIALAEFVRVVLAIRRNRVYVLYLFVLAAVYVLGYFLSATASLGVETALLLGGQIILLPVSVLLPIPVLWVWRRRGSLDALLLAIPLLVRAVISFDNLWRVVTEVLFHRHSALLPPLISYVSWFEVSDITFILTLLLFIVVRTIRIVRARADLAAEVHAAQSVQQLLLNRSNQATPGFAVETVYLPAAEVGGDFFLVSPGEDGSLVAVVGDVSGKGLTAAMRVSMILGVLRRESSRNPAQVLFALNEALLSQGELGFTTACCALLLPDGFYTIANAGHINPYLDGRELETAPALPLGLAPDQHYANLSGRLAPSQTLVLLTDGIPEARNAKGELYGFEALGTLTREPASRIAAAAQRFGQEDDITVLTLALA